VGQGAALGLCNSNYLGDGPTRSIGLPGALRALRASGPTPLSVPHVGNGQRDITPIRPVTPHRFVYLPPMNSAASSIPLKVHLRAAGVENGPPIGRSRRRCRQAAAEWCRPRSGRSRHRISPPQTGRSVRSLRSSTSSAKMLFAPLPVAEQSYLRWPWLNLGPRRLCLLWLVKATYRSGWRPRTCHRGPGAPSGPSSLHKIRICTHRCEIEY